MACKIIVNVLKPSQSNLKTRLPVIREYLINMLFYFANMLEK